MKLLASMQQRLVRPDAVCFSAALASLGRLGSKMSSPSPSRRSSGHWREVLELYTRAVASGAMDAAAVNAAASACEKLSQWPLALEILKQRDDTSANVAISCWAQGAEWL